MMEAVNTLPSQWTESQDSPLTSSTEDADWLNDPEFGEDPWLTGLPPPEWDALCSDTKL